MFASY